MMSLTDFQTRCRQRCTDLFREISSLTYRDFEEVIGKSETYFKATAGGPHHTLEVYIYTNEAGYMLDGKRWTIFEKPDYRSEDELLQAFLKGLREKLLDVAK